MLVRVYLTNNNTYEFPARNILNAREIAARCTREGFWTEDNGDETFYPVHVVYKARIIK